MNGFIINTDDYSTLLNNIKKLNPILFTIVNDLNIIKLSIETQPDLLIQDDKKLKDYHSFNDIYILQNNDIFDSLDIKRFILFDINQLPQSDFNISQYSLSILKGKQTIPLTIGSHNYNIIGVLEGEATIHIFNPKHKEEIINKENNKIKKWGHKKIIKKNNIIIIPPYWYYILECEKEIIQYHIEIDNIFTIIPNYLRDI